MQTAIEEKRYRGGKGLSESRLLVESLGLDGRPLDLRDWIESSLLFSWIEAEVERFVSSPDDSQSGTGAMYDRFRKILQILCFAYSTGRGRSADIAAGCRCEVEFQMIAENCLPFVDELVNFRRHHRALLEELLSRLYLRAACFSIGYTEEVSETLEKRLRGRAKDFLNTARHLDSCD